MKRPDRTTLPVRKLVDHLALWDDVGQAEITFAKGERVAWLEPAGLLDVTLIGRIVGMQVECGELFIIAFDVEPSEALRRCAWWLKSRLRLEIGRVWFATGESFSAAVRRGTVLVLGSIEA